MRADRLVARPNAGSCLVCDLPTEDRQAVNAAIWQGDTAVRFYIQAGHRAFEAQTQRSCDRKVIIRHRAHTEASWRAVTTNDPIARGEEQVFPSDYESLVDRAASVGASALEELGGKVKSLAARELLGVARMGLEARSKQRALEQDKNRPELQVTAIFAMASGHIREEDIPEGQVVEVTDPRELKATVQAERKLLEERAGTTT